MFNIGFVELIILAVIGLLVLGPEELPQLARKAAKTLNDLKRASEEFMRPMNDIKNETEKAMLKARQEIATQLANQQSDKEEVAKAHSVEKKKS